jgi:hypothetical protein
MDEASYLDEDFKLHEVNFKGLFSSTTPLQSKTHTMDLAWLKEPLL